MKKIGMFLILVFVIVLLFNCTPNLPEEEILKIYILGKEAAIGKNYSDYNVTFRMEDGTVVNMDDVVLFNSVEIHKYYKVTFKIIDQGLGITSKKTIRIVEIDRF